MKLKVSFLLMLLLSHSAHAQQRQISHVDISGSWYHVYDTNGKKITTLANQSVGELASKLTELNVYRHYKMRLFNVCKHFILVNFDVWKHFIIFVAE